MTHPPRCRDKTLADAIRVQSFSDGVNWMGVIDPAQSIFHPFYFIFCKSVVVAMFEKPPSSPQGEVVQYASLKVRVRGTHTRYRRDSFCANHKL